MAGIVAGYPDGVAPLYVFSAPPERVYFLCSPKENRRKEKASMRRVMKNKISFVFHYSLGARKNQRKSNSLILLHCVCKMWLEHGDLLDLIFSCALRLHRKGI
ncbi:MAG: hypothetical protein PVF75_05625 [Granulosicoccaceae bacterium]|jgi:hypothetical protein